MPTAREIQRARLLDANGVGSGRFTGGGGSVDHARAMAWAKFQQSNMGRLLANDPTALRNAFEQQQYGGGFPFQFGQMPNEADLNRWLDKSLGQQSSGQRPSGGSVRPGSYVDGLVANQSAGQQQAGMGGMSPDAFNALFMLGAMADEDARNAAVKKRETEIRGSMDGLYDRVMGRVENYNKAQAALTEEQAQQRIRSGEARRARNGLGNNTINDAFREQTERNRDLQLQDLSEDTDERAIRHDMALTQDKNRFVENIVDRGPDMTQIINLAQQLGLSGGGGLFGGAAQRSVPAMAPAAIGNEAGNRQAGRGPMMTPWGPVQQADRFGGMFRQPIAANPMIDPRNPMAAIGAQQQAVGQVVGQPGGISSNRYPQQRDPEFLKLLQKAAASNRSGVGNLQRVQWQAPAQQGWLGGLLSQLTGQQPQGKYTTVTVPRRSSANSTYR